MGQATRTPEGYIRVEAIIARSGIQEYQGDNGEIRKELRHPDDVFSQAALDSLTMLPVSNLHPSEMVDPENVKRIQCGFTGENVRVDGKFIKIPLVVNDADAIADVEAGRRELSVGYTVDLIEEQGAYDGQPYTHRQTNIRGNHVALVDRARAGREARINIDGGMNMENKLVTVVLDGIEYQASPEVQRELQKANKRADEAVKASETLKSEKDQLQAKLDEEKTLSADLQKKLDEASDQKKIDAAVKARIDLLTKAALVCKDVDFTGKTDREVMEAVVKAKHDGLDLTDKSEVYVLARFDAVVESLGKDALAAQRKQTAPIIGVTDGDDGDSEKARKDAADAIRNAWKGEKK